MSKASRISKPATKPTIYLAGPVAAVDDGGAGWREMVKKRFGDVIDTRNPLSKYNVPLDDLVIVETETTSKHTVSAAEIVESDKALLEESDGVLVGYSDVHSTGTPMEVMWAFERDMPIVLWRRDGTPRSELSPWYQYHVDQITSSLPVALYTLERLIAGGDA